MRHRSRKWHFTQLAARRWVWHLAGTTLRSTSSFNTLVGALDDAILHGFVPGISRIGLIRRMIRLREPRGRRAK